MNVQTEMGDESVEYCKACLSLAVIEVDDEICCRECWSTEIGEESIENWEKMYRSRYGIRYLEKRSNKKITINNEY